MCAQTSRQPEIVFGLAGEGRGHATRALSLVKAIGQGYRYRLLTSHDAFRFLEPLVADLPHVTHVNFQSASATARTLRLL